MLLMCMGVIVYAFALIFKRNVNKIISTYERNISLQNFILFFLLLFLFYSLILTYRYKPLRQYSVNQVIKKLWPYVFCHHDHVHR